MSSYGALKSAFLIQCQPKRKKRVLKETAKTRTRNVSRKMLFVTHEYGILGNIVFGLAATYVCNSSSI